MQKIVSALSLSFLIVACAKTPPHGDPIFEQPAEEWTTLAKDVDLKRLVRLHIEIERYYGKDIFFEDEFAARGHDGLVALLNHIAEEGSPLNSYKNYHGFEVVMIKSRTNREYDYCTDKTLKFRITEVAKETIINQQEAKSYVKTLFEDC